MKTLRLAVDPAHAAADAPAIAQAAQILRRGGTVAFPTETVYGLGANALDPAAVAKIFAAKERPGWDPVIVHIGDPAMLDRVAVSIPANARALSHAFWPGPLTLLLPRHPDVPNAVTAKRERVGVRMPAHPVALALLRAAQLPVAAPSANRFGRTSATTAAHVAEDLDGRIDAILDAGPTTHGIESTVVDVREDGCTIFRPGVITLEQIRRVCQGNVSRLADAPSGPVSDPAPGEAAGHVSPGLGLRHYAPRARLLLVEHDSPIDHPDQPRRLVEAVFAAHQPGELVGILLPTGFPAPALDNIMIFEWGDWGNSEELARRLFAGLRWLDAAGVTVIVCPLPEDHGLGAAICDRLRKAARR